MSYQETIKYLFNIAPLFQNIGAGAYKEGLSNTFALDNYFGHPHLSYKTIHVGGTNGKGSVSHTLAAILQSAGLRVGLFTSPHLVDFRERIRVNGEMIPEQRVVDFVDELKGSPFGERLEGAFSFFELTTALAFQYFKEQHVDIAVIEVGLGGRLDCTNIITPLLSVITNISFDHTQFLGSTLEQIASEKAGIIKPNIPVIIGETEKGISISKRHADTRTVFLNKSLETNSPIIFADEEDEVEKCLRDNGRVIYKTRHFGSFKGELQGLCQEHNTATILAAVRQLSNLNLHLSVEHIHQGFAHVCELTGLMGRWQKLQDRPTVVCDTGHNPGGIKYIAEQLRDKNYELQIATRDSKLKTHDSRTGTRDSLRIVLGMVSDKDIRGSLSLFPKDAIYYFTQASVRRAMPADEIAAIGKSLGLQSRTDKDGRPITYPTVSQAYDAALADANTDDFIFVGGSSFVVADLLTSLGLSR